MPNLVPYPIEDLRRDMLVKLCTPEGRRIVKALAKEQGFAERWRQELVAMLTAHLENARIERPGFHRGPGTSMGTPRV